MTKKRKDGRIDDRPSAAKVALPGARRGPGTFYLDPYDVVLVGYDVVPGYDATAGKSHVLYNVDVHSPVREEVVTRIRRAGRLLTPIKVKKEGDLVLCVEGRDRVKALRALKDEGTVIECWAEVIRGSEVELLGAMVDCNMGRKNDNPVTVAYFANRLLGAGIDVESVSERVRLNAREVPLLVKILDTCEEVRAAVALGTLPWRKAARLAGKSLVEQRAALAHTEADPALRPPKQPSRKKKQAVHAAAERWTDDKAKTLLGWALGYVSDVELAKAYPQLAVDIMPKDSSERNKPSEAKVAAKAKAPVGA